VPNFKSRKNANAPCNPQLCGVFNLKITHSILRRPIFLNAAHVHGDRVPKTVRLQHSMIPIDDLNRTGWEPRSDKLMFFVAEDGWLWSPGITGSLSHERLLTWMKAPGPENLLRYYKYWGVEDIFTAVTRRPNTRSALWLGVRGLVELRNNIAHGDYAAQATQADVRRYMGHAREFCVRADRRLSVQIARSFDVQSPWY
jgi:hypothetical protein